MRFSTQLQLVASAAVGLAALSLAVPLANRAAEDAPFSVPLSTIEAAITCPTGLTSARGGVVLLVHGTGSTGAESWASGPYVKLLPQAGEGYDVCWVDLPNRALNDAQRSAEYVAHGIQFLAGKSATGKVTVVGHSQGAGLNPQWALTFWPSTIPLVSQYIALAPDFHGTLSAAFACPSLDSCCPANWQQSSFSRYGAAQNSLLPGGGGQALVPTLSIFTVQDEVVTPESPRAKATSNLNGATVKALQDLDVCGPTHTADHFSIVADPAAYTLALSLLTSTPFNPLSCVGLVNNSLLSAQAIGANLNAVVQDALAFATCENVKEEPALQPYVCARGFATTCGAAFA